MHDDMATDQANKWTDQYPRIVEMREMLYTYDRVANNALDRIDMLSPPGDKDVKGCPMASRDLYSLVKRYSDSDEVIRKLWTQVTDVPDWVDWEQIRRGQKLVYQYHPQMQLGLLFTSLVGGMAHWRIVETLSRTGGFGLNVCRRRILETLQHFVEVIESLESVKPDGNGFKSSVRVRLLHANVRRRIMRLEKQRPDYYNTQEWGVPINDLHQISTIIAYSASLVFVSLPRQGIYCTEQQITDYLALWRWIGFIMGTPVDWMATPSSAKAMMEMLHLSEMKPSDNSRIIANNIITAQVACPPLYASRPLLTALAYRLEGDEIAAALDIARPNVCYRSLAILQGYIFTILSSSYGLLPEWLQARRDKVFLQYTREIVTNRKLGGMGSPAKFEFQYMPEIGQITEMGKVHLGIWQWTFGSLVISLTWLFRSIFALSTY